MSIECDTTTTTGGKVVQAGEVLLTRVELAQALSVSVRTVDALVADEEITPVRLRGKLVRFYLPDVMRELREKAQASKRRVTREV